MVPVNPIGPTGLPAATDDTTDDVNDNSTQEPIIVSVSDVIYEETQEGGAPTEEPTEPTLPDDAYRPVETVEPTP
jgi:hypothetical protein